jgi:hypothetical protein
MTAGCNNGVIEKVFADLTSQRGLERREQLQWRVEPVRGIGEIERRLHGCLRFKTCRIGALLTLKMMGRGSDRCSSLRLLRP